MHTYQGKQKLYVRQIFKHVWTFYISVHLLGPMPHSQRNLKWKKQPKGVANRNRALEWIMQNASLGVFYFADDDNTYDSKIFELIRFIGQFDPLSIFSLKQVE